MMSTEHVAGITFASSMRGWRYDRLNQRVLLASITGWIFLSDYVQFGEPDWGGPFIMVLVWVIMSWLMRGANKRRVFGSQIRIREEQLDVVDAGVPANIPWKDILYIRIDRSPSGHRRNFRIRARGGRLFTLLDPENGDLLESWALGVAKGEGIKIRLRTWVTLNAEPVWTLLFIGLALVLSKYLSVFDLF